MSFQQIEGSRKNSIVFVSDYFLYIRRRNYKNKVYLRCRKDDCRATALVVDNIFTIEQEHDHPNEKEEVERLLLVSSMKTKAEQEATPLREIYDSVKANNTTLPQFHGKYMYFTYGFI